MRLHPTCASLGPWRLPPLLLPLRLLTRPVAPLPPCCIPLWCLLLRVSFLAAACPPAPPADIPVPTVAPGLPCSGVEELERDICFILGLLAIKVEHQSAICEAGALPTLVSMIRRYAGKNDVHLSGVPAQTCRRTSDAITNLAHENNSIKNKVRQEGGIPPLVSLLHSVDPKVQRAVAGSLRTLAFKNEENKNIIVDLGSLPLLIQMLRSDDTTIHYEVRPGGQIGTRREVGRAGEQWASHARWAPPAVAREKQRWQPIEAELPRPAEGSLGIGRAWRACLTHVRAA